jgi:hypothetical protein
MKLGLYPSGPSHYNNSAFLWPQGQATAPRERLYPTDGLSTVGAVAGAVEGRIPYYESDVTTKPKPAGRIPGGKTKPATSTSAAAQPVNFMDYTPASMDPWAWNSPAPTIPSTRQPQPPLDYPSVTSTAQRSPLDLNQFMVNTNPAATMTGNSATNPSAYHIGDILQAVEVASKFAQANQKVEVQRPYTDNTPVSRAAYDPSQALYQSSRNFRNSVNSIDTASPNLRRAFANSAYATRMNQDNATISQYDQMNRQGLVDYESRLSNQRRYNNQMNLTVDDINARNRGTQQNAIQNSFTSLGNFGEQLNRKDQATAALNVLKVMYPDIYSRMMTSI